MTKRSNSSRRRFIGLAAAGVGDAALARPARAAGAPHYAVAPPSLPSLPIAGSRERFPVHRIYCMGLNYAEHSKESGMSDIPPFYFQKSADMIVENYSTVSYPGLTHDYQHEIELVVAMASGGSVIPAEKALDYVFGYAVGLDMTRRDLQTDALKKGLPWEPGKSFEQCAPCSAIFRATEVGHLQRGRIELRVNDQLRQGADLSDMIYDVARIINHLSQSIMLAPGELIYTGTPAGVGPVVSGDRMVGLIDRLGTLTITVG
jgi:fumarylpyruvate hydrolase